MSTVIVPPGTRMSGPDDAYEWSAEDVVLQARPMIAVRRVDQAHIAIRERCWPEGDFEIVLLFEDLPRLIERLEAMHTEWRAQQQGRGDRVHDGGSIASSEGH